MTSTSDARILNRQIDRLLTGAMDADALMTTARQSDPVALAERIRRRASRLIRLQSAPGQTILDARDHLILAVYASTLPENACAGWCDGSSVGMESASSHGIGIIVTDNHGRIVATNAERIWAATPFETEIAALARTLGMALAHDVQHLRVHTDCPALVQLWQKHPLDARLAAIRRLCRDFERLELKAVPRQHNQPAHRLAQAAARAGGIQ